MSSAKQDPSPRGLKNNPSDKFSPPREEDREAHNRESTGDFSPKVLEEANKKRYENVLQKGLEEGGVGSGKTFTALSLVLKQIENSTSGESFRKTVAEGRSNKQYPTTIEKDAQLFKMASFLKTGKTMDSDIIQADRPDLPSHAEIRNFTKTIAVSSGVMVLAGLIAWSQGVVSPEVFIGSTLLLAAIIAVSISAYKNFEPNE